MKKLNMHKVGKNNFRLKESENNYFRSESKMDFSWTTLVSLILTAFTAVAFGSGQAYRNAYLRPFNFDTSLIPWSFQDTVYLGIVKQISVLLIAPLWTLLGLFTIIGFFIFIVEIKNLKKKKLKKNPGQNELDRFELHHPAIALILALLAFSAKFVTFTFIVILMSTFFVAKAERMGADDATKDMAVITKASKNDRKKDLRKVEITRTLNNKNYTETGYLVDCNERACGIYSPSVEDHLKIPLKINRIVYLDNVTSFVITKPF